MSSRPNNSVTFLTSIPAGSLLRTLKVKSLNDFKKLIQSKPGADTDKGGALILQGLIIKKFKKQVPRGTPDLAKRLSYFRSANFIHNFLTDIPARDKWDENKSETSYTAWFNTLFSVSFSDWRESKLIVTGNQEQCKRALRENVNINSKPRCYLCGDLFLKKHDTKECEHVLPVVSALSHLWLTQERIDRYSQGEQNALRLEYDWSHRCCNQIKSNYEFVILNYKGKRYDINTPLVETYYSHLRDSNKYDCSKIALKNIPPKVIEGLHARLRGITKIINTNIQSLGSLDLYHLLIKFKVLSAFTDDVFLEALTGNGEAVVRRSIDPEVIKASRKRNAELEREIKEAEEAFFAYKKASAERRRLKYESSENPTATANNTSTVASDTRILVGGEGNNSHMDEQENTDIIDAEFAPFDEDLSFPVSFLRLIGVPEGESLERIDEYIINYILTSPRYEPNEEQVDAFLIEQGVLSPTTNVKFTLYNKVPNFKFSLMKSPKQGAFAPPATPNLHIRGKRRANNYNNLGENYTNNRSGMTPDKRIRLQSSNETMTIEGGRRSRNIRKKKVKGTTRKLRR